MTPSYAHSNYPSTIVSMVVQATLVTPWRSMLTSGPVWAIIIAHFTENWGFYTLLTGLPSFMRQEIRTLVNTETLLSED